MQEYKRAIAKKRPVQLSAGILHSTVAFCGLLAACKETGSVYTLCVYILCVQ